MSFSGSYLPTDVDFLLEIKDFQEISILEKERLIQTGEKHYSEVLTEEMDFPSQYLDLFSKIFIKNIHNVSSDILCIYETYNQYFPHNPITFFRCILN